MVNASSAPFEHGDDEARLLDIHMEDSSTVTPQRVAESPASIECRLHSLVDLGTSTLILGTVLAATVWESALDGDHPTMEALQPLSRLGRNEWGRPPEVIAIDRPQRPEDVHLP